MKILFPLAFSAAAVFSTQNCTDQAVQNIEKQKAPLTATQTPPLPLPSVFNDYWYAGKAEISTYEVSQERYGEIRPAEQVNVFVTEDLSKAKQVKLDDPANAAEDRIPVLKLNSIRRFHTGIYDYSIMQSVFTPVSGASTLKTTTSVQDWCGQVFLQYNLNPSGYKLRSFSYFEGDGDNDLQLPLLRLEDELWTRIRLNPFALPTGQYELIPSAVYTRLRHKPCIPQKAQISMEKGENESVLTINYLSISRSLSIRFESAFPFKILGWEETNEGKLASKGALKAMRNSAYWGEHDNVNAPLRDSLKLRF